MPQLNYFNTDYAICGCLLNNLNIIQQIQPTITFALGIDGSPGFKSNKRLQACTF